MEGRNKVFRIFEYGGEGGGKYDGDRVVWLHRIFFVQVLFLFLFFGL